MKISPCKIIIILFLFKFTILPAQNIKGHLINQDTQQPVMFATIQLFEDDSLVSATISDTSGFFYLLIKKKKLNIKKTKLIINCLTYMEKKISGNQLKDNLGTINMIPDIKVLKEVKVTGEQERKKITVNKTIIKPDSMISKTTTDLLDYFDKLSDITVDKQTSSIKITGKNGNALILINGALADPVDLLSIKPENVDHIEIIKNASVKYGADAKGVINIILKKRQEGYSIDIKLDYASKLRNINPHLNFRYTKQKISLFLFYGFNGSNNISSTYTETNFNNSNTTYNNSITYESYNPFRQNHIIKYGIDFFIDKNNYLNITTKNTFFSNKSHGNINTKLFKNDSLINVIENTSKLNSRSRNNNYSLFFKHTFKNNQLITLNYNLYFFRGGFMDSYSNNHIDTTESRKESNNLRIDYEKEINKKLKLETGYNFFNRNINDNFYSISSSYNLFFKEIRHSFYTQFHYSFTDKLSSNAGVRYENSDMNLYGNKKSIIYFLLPTLGVNYKINKIHNFTLSFNKETSYPSYSQMEPFPYYNTDSLSYTIGNPDLRPERFYYCNLDYNFFLNNSFYFTFSGFYNPANNLISNIFSFKDNIQKETFTNASISLDKGVSLSLSINPVSFWMLKMYGRFSHYSIKNLSLQNSDYIYLFNMYNIVSLPKEISFDFGFFIQPKVIDLQGYSDKYFIFPDISLTKQLFKKKGFITIGVSFPFKDFSNKSYYYANNVDIYSKFDYTFQYAYILFKYSLFKGRVKSIDREYYFEDDTSK